MDPCVCFMFRGQKFVFHEYILDELPLIKQWWFGRRVYYDPTDATTKLHIFDETGTFKDMIPEARHLNAIIKWTYTRDLEVFEDIYTWDEFVNVCDLLCSTAPAHARFALRGLVTPTTKRNVYWTRGWWRADVGFAFSRVMGFFASTIMVLSSVALLQLIFVSGMFSNYGSLVRLMPLILDRSSSIDPSLEVRSQCYEHLKQIILHDEGLDMSLPRGVDVLETKLQRTMKDVLCYFTQC